MNCGVEVHINTYIHTHTYMCIFIVYLLTIAQIYCVTWFLGCPQVHERSADSDLFSLFIKKSIVEGLLPHTKLIIMTATMNEDFIEFFKNCNQNKEPIPVIFAGAHSHGVTSFYLEDLIRTDTDVGFQLTQQMKNAVKRILEKITKYPNTGKDAAEDVLNGVFSEKFVTDLVVYLVRQIAKRGLGKCVLVFLSGIHRMWEVEQALREAWPPVGLNILKLHSLIPDEDQHKIEDFKADAERCTVILSTTVAESSLTIDALDYVIDTGMLKYVTLHCFTRTKMCHTKPSHLPICYKQVYGAVRGHIIFEVESLKQDCNYDCNYAVRLLVLQLVIKSDHVLS
jgi:HrpA-like RNA helicase